MTTCIIKRLFLCNKATKGSPFVAFARCRNNFDLQNINGKLCVLDMIMVLLYSYVFFQSGDAPTPSSNQKKAPNATPTSNKKQQQQTPGSSQKTKKVVLKGGLLVEDVKEGHGPEARPGATVRGWRHIMKGGL